MDDYHLFEDGFIMLYEDGGKMILDSSGVGNWIPQTPSSDNWVEQQESDSVWSQV